MLNLKQSALFVSLIIISNTAVSGTYTGELTIKSIRVKPSNSFDVRTIEVVNPDCAEEGKFFRIESGEHGMTNEGVKNSLSVALSAFMAGKKVVAFVDSTSVYCHSYMIEVR